MKDLIFISGAPGSGKTTMSSLLARKLEGTPPRVDFGHIRAFHLNEEWSNTSEAEEEMSFKNLIFILKNYLKNGYKNIIIDDLKDFRIQQLANLFPNTDYIIVSLVLDDEEELVKRVVNESRDSGFRNVEQAKLWNRNLKKRASVKNEIKIENSHTYVEQTAKKILDLVGSYTPSLL